MSKTPRWPDGQEIVIRLDPNLPLDCIRLESPLAGRLNAYQQTLLRQAAAMFRIDAELLKPKGGSR